MAHHVTAPGGDRIPLDRLLLKCVTLGSPVFECAGFEIEIERATIPVEGGHGLSRGRGNLKRVRQQRQAGAAYRKTLFHRRSWVQFSGRIDPRKKFDTRAFIQGHVALCRDQTDTTLKQLFLFRNLRRKPLDRRMVCCHWRLGVSTRPLEC